MPPPPEEEERPLPPKPKPKPPKPKPKPPKPKTAPEPEPEPEPKPMPARPEPRRDVTAGGGGGPFPPDPTFCADNCSGTCALLPHCQQRPPPSPATTTTTVRLNSSRLPTPLIAVSASLLAFLAVLALALLVRRCVLRRRRARNGPLAQHGAQGAAQLQQVLAGEVVVGGEVEDDEEAADAGVHHVWYIRTKGLDERAIAAIAAVVYDAKKKRGAGGGGGADDDASCAVCLAEFRDGETLRLLPRCGHAFHRGCIDTWLRAHVNCPLCRAPVVQAAPATGAAGAPGTNTAAVAADRSEAEANLGAVGGVRAEGETARAGAPERAVRRAASMVALPRRAWPDVSFRSAPSSNSGREEDMRGLGKIMRLLKFSDSLEMNGVGAGRSVSLSAGSCLQLPTRSSGPSAAGVSADETSQ